MKKVISLYLLLIFVLSGCGMAADDTESAAAIPDNAVWVDVRTPGEYDAGHIPDTHLAPLDTLPASLSSLVEDKETPVVVYCRSGNRSAKAKRLLEKDGYREVIDFGGIDNWQGDLETGPSEEAKAA